MNHSVSKSTWVSGSHSSTRIWFLYVVGSLQDSDCFPGRFPGLSPSWSPQEFYFKDRRVFPSYLQTGKNYLIEKSKRRMIAEDIKRAIEWSATA